MKRIMCFTLAFLLIFNSYFLLKENISFANGADIPAPMGGLEILIAGMCGKMGIDAQENKAMVKDMYNDLYSANETISEGRKALGQSLKMLVSNAIKVKFGQKDFTGNTTLSFQEYKEIVEGFHAPVEIPTYIPSNVMTDFRDYAKDYYEENSIEIPSVPLSEVDLIKSKIRNQTFFDRFDYMMLKTFDTVGKSDKIAYTMYFFQKGTKIIVREKGNGIFTFICTSAYDRFMSNPVWISDNNFEMKYMSDWGSGRGFKFDAPVMGIPYSSNTNAIEVLDYSLKEDLVAGEQKVYDVTGIPIASNPWEEDTIGEVIVPVPIGTVIGGEVPGELTEEELVKEYERVTETVTPDTSVDNIDDKILDQLKEINQNINDLPVPPPAPKFTDFFKSLFAILLKFLMLCIAIVRAMFRLLYLLLTLKDIKPDTSLFNEHMLMGVQFVRDLNYKGISLMGMITSSLIFVFKVKLTGKMAKKLE